MNEVRAAMTELAKQKAGKMTPAERSAHARKMIAARGNRWRVINGKRVYYAEAK
jgi:hypothetical protein